MTDIKHSLAYRPDIDGLRTLAVLSVVLFHFQVPYFSGGFVGVDIFFVISGFLISTILVREFEKTKTISIKNFYIRRARRILPAYFSTMIFTIVIGFFCFSPSHFQKFGESLFSSIFMVANFHFYFEADYFDVSSNFKPLLHLWSLSIEEQFYIFWPLILIFLLKRQKKISIWFGFITLFCLSFVLNLVIHYTSLPIFTSLLMGRADGGLTDVRPEMFFLLPYRFFEFLFGAVLVLVPENRLANPIREFLFTSGLSLTLVAIFNYSEGMVFPSFYAILPCLGTALMIYSRPKKGIIRLFTNKVSVEIGKISYSLYMIHWPVFVYGHYMGIYTGAMGYFGTNAGILTSIGLSFLSFRYIELPFRVENNRSVFMRYSGLPSIGLVVALLLTSVSIAKDGWIWRTPVSIDYKDIGNFHVKNYGGADYLDYKIIRDSNKSRIVLMGDSQGLHYAHGILKELVEPFDRSFANASGRSCFHLPNFTRTTSGHNWNKICPESLEQGLNFLGFQNKNFLILSHSWLSQMKIGGLLIDGKVQERDLSYEDIYAGILSLVRRLGAKKIIIIGNVPTTGGVDVVSEYTRPALLPFQKKDRNQALFIKRDRVDKKFNSFNLFMKEKLSKHKQILFLNPFDVLCDEERCYNMNKSKILYSDKSHLSKDGSIFVIQSFLPQIESFLKLSKADNE